jgi:L-amino acid N-acyltransferase YncA
VAGRLDDLVSRPLVCTAARVTLLPPGNLAFFDRYAKVYADLFASHPKHREYNLPQDKEALAEALQEGLLFEVLVDGSWAGIVSALPQAPAGLTGFTVQEMLLDQAHRGQGFGPAMQQRLIEHLRGQDDAVLAGTIHAGNVASLASARRVGRDVIATYVWVTPTRSGAQGMPGLNVQ